MEIVMKYFEEFMLNFEKFNNLQTIIEIEIYK